MPTDDPAAPPPPSNRRAVIATIFNQKGGVGKTTTSVNLATCLAAGGVRVLVIDFDPQGSATANLGLIGRPVPGSYELLMTGTLSATLMQTTAFPGVMLCPAGDALAGADLELAICTDAQNLLRQALHNARVPIDVIIIDCPPTLSMLALNALVASDAVVMPVTPDPMARDVLHRAWRHIQRIRSTLNPNLAIAGVVLTMVHDNPVHREFEQTIRGELGNRVLPVAIPFDTAILGSSRHDLPVCVFAPQSAAAQAYLALAAVIQDRMSALSRPVAQPAAFCDDTDGAEPACVMTPVPGFSHDTAAAALRFWSSKAGHTEPPAPVTKAATVAAPTAGRAPASGWHSPDRITGFAAGCVLGIVLTLLARAIGL
ncbi:MAG: AAA family ATPase [Azospirillaceae bacterium]|nr:AAA family ATPase [Azospirillaceae bacterium]